MKTNWLECSFLCFTSLKCPNIALWILWYLNSCYSEVHGPTFFNIDHYQAVFVPNEYSYYTSCFFFQIALEIIKQVYKQDGVRGFYRGYFASICTYVPNSALWWSFYHFYQGNSRISTIFSRVLKCKTSFWWWKWPNNSDTFMRTCETCDPNMSYNHVSASNLRAFGTELLFTNYEKVIWSMTSVHFFSVQARVASSFMAIHGYFRFVCRPQSSWWRCCHLACVRCCWCSASRRR